MAISLTKQYLRSEYEVELQGSINSNLASISSDITTINTAISTFSGNITSISGSITSISGSITTLSGNITTLSGNITTLSGNITSILDFTTISADATAAFTLDLTTYRNFEITNADTATKTLLIASVPTASDTMVDVSLRLKFTSTATVTYTGTITWPGGTAPNPTAAGTFMINLKSFDAGTSWLASYTGLY